MNCKEYAKLLIWLNGKLVTKCQSHNEFWHHILSAFLWITPSFYFKSVLLEIFGICEYFVVAGSNWAPYLHCSLQCPLTQFLLLFQDLIPHQAWTLCIWGFKDPKNLLSYTNPLLHDISGQLKTVFIEGSLQSLYSMVEHSGIPLNVQRGRKYSSLSSCLKLFAPLNNKSSSHRAWHAV